MGPWRQNTGGEACLTHARPAVSRSKMNPKANVMVVVVVGRGGGEERDK